MTHKRARPQTDRERESKTAETQKKNTQRNTHKADATERERQRKTEKERADTTEPLKSHLLCHHMQTHTYIYLSS